MLLECGRACALGVRTGKWVVACARRQASVRRRVGRSERGVDACCVRAQADVIRHASVLYALATAHWHCHSRPRIGAAVVRAGRRTPGAGVCRGSRLGRGVATRVQLYPGRLDRARL
eukprot:6393466-Prymnesium_polylepis.1